MTSAAKTGAGNAIAHDSALKHITGSARYTDDIPLPQDAAHAYLGLSEVAAGTITRLDLSAVEAHPGVLGTVGWQDIQGENDVSPSGCGDDPIFAREIAFWGQPLFAVVAETRDIARAAARLAIVEVQTKEPALKLEEASEMVAEPLTLRKGDVAAGLSRAPNRLKGQINIGGQDHFYLEGQIALAIPGEDETLTVWSSTQHPSEVQHMVAQALQLSQAEVTVKVQDFFSKLSNCRNPSSEIPVRWPLEVRAKVSLTLAASV